MLEFPRIREILAGFTSFSTSRELANSIQPLKDYEQISLLLKQSAEAHQLLRLDPAFSIGDVTDIRERVKMAALGSILDPKDLLEIARTLASLRQLRSSLTKLSSEFTLLWNIVKDIIELPQIEKNIARCLDPAGEVLDTASPTLANIRQELRHARNQLLERLQVIIRSPKIQRLLQEELITQRNDRYVIPVKIENRHEIKGIIHDISNTGATAFIEPTATVSLGNALRELVIAERNEIQRILAALSAEIGEHQLEISRNIALAAELDLILAKARYALKAGAAEPLLTTFDGSEDKVSHKLIEGRHPLLWEKAVPLTVEIGRDFSVLVITGPNTGGKTVALKTMGLLSLMTQAGIPIPASAESRLPVFDNIFSDIGDEQSIEQTLSTFSWHMSNIIRIISNATRKSLVLLDELGTSTDPAQGSALARALLRHFLSLGSITAATTHFSDLKVFAHVTPGLQNASFDFDPVTLKPNYHLTVGIPGESNALATASRLGLPLKIIDEAKSLLSRGSLELESLLTDLRKERQTLQELHRNLKKERDEVEKRDAELEAELKQFNAEKRRLIQETRDKLVRESSELHKEIKEAASELRRQKSEEKIEQARKALAAVRQKLASQAFTPKQEKVEEGEDGRIAVGDTVWLKEAYAQATVLSVSEETQQVEVQAGQARVTLSLDSVAKMTSPESAAAAGAPGISRPAKRRVPIELDLRGKRAHEVEPLLDTYLNDASLTNLREVRIIHGYGTGTVRNLVRSFLATHPLVKSFRPGKEDEGGDGVSIVTL